MRKRNFTMLPALFFAAFGAFYADIAAAEQMLLQWVPDQSGSQLSDQSPIPGSSIVAKLAPGDLTQIGDPCCTNQFVWPVSVSAPRSSGRYLEFSITPSQGRLLALRRIIYPGRSYFDSNLGLHLRSSLDGFSQDLDSDFTSASGARDSRLVFEVNSLPLLSDTTLTFRLYPDRIGNTSDFLDLRGEDGLGLQVQGELATRLDFGDAQFYSFSREAVGGFELPDNDRHIRMIASNASTLRLQNQFSGDARALCLSGQKDFFAADVLDAAVITEQFPACLRIDKSDLPSDVSIWKLPDGPLFRLQILEFDIINIGPESFPIYAVSGRLQAGPVLQQRILADRFEQ